MSSDARQQVAEGLLSVTGTARASGRPLRLITNTSGMRQPSRILGTRGRGSSGLGRTIAASATEAGVCVGISCSGGERGASDGWEAEALHQSKRSGVDMST